MKIKNKMVPMYTTVVLRLHYVPGGCVSPVSSKRVVPWNFGHIFLWFQNLLRLVKFSYATCTISVKSRASDKPVCHGAATLQLSTTYHDY